MTYNISIVFWALSIIFYLQAIFTQSCLSTTPSKKPPPSYSQWNRKLPEFLNKVIGKNYRLAGKADFVPVLRNSKDCSMYAIDLNEDGLQDYALLLVNTQNGNFRFQILINKGNNTFKSVLSKDYIRATQPKNGVIYVSMVFKPNEKEGITNREYTNFRDRQERENYQCKPTIEISYPPYTLHPDLDSGSTSLQKFLKQPIKDQLSSIDYCTDAYYFVNDQLKTREASD